VDTDDGGRAIAIILPNIVSFAELRHSPLAGG